MGAQMENVKKAKLAVGMGLLVCVLGLAFVSMGKANALQSSGYGPLKTLGFFDSVTGAGSCVAIKGESRCVSRANL